MDIQICTVYLYDEPRVHHILDGVNGLSILCPKEESPAGTAKHLKKGWAIEEENNKEAILFLLFLESSPPPCQLTR